VKRYILRKLGQAPLLLLFVTALVYFPMRLFGGSADSIVQGILNLNYSDEGARQLKKELALDKSIPAGYVDWLFKALRGDLGTSYAQRRPVRSILGETFPFSLQLVIMTLCLTALLTVPLAIYSAYRPGSKRDRAINGFAFGTLSMPGFLIGLLLIFFVSLGTRAGGVTLIPSGVFPAGSNNVGFWNKPFDSVREMFLPALALSLGQFANFLRILRTDMLNSLQEDFVTLAKSKGLSDRYILWRHALRPSSFTLITVAGISIGTLIGNALIIESLFTINGMGSTVVRAVFARDVPLVLGGVTVIAIIFVLTTTAVDVLYGIIDPRVRAARSLG
jgi:peptide/nickel transport system permease protein